MWLSRWWFRPGDHRKYSGECRGGGSSARKERKHPGDVCAAANFYCSACNCETTQFNDIDLNDNEANKFKPNLRKSVYQLVSITPLKVFTITQILN